MFRERPLQRSRTDQETPSGLPARHLRRGFYQTPASRCGILDQPDSLRADGFGGVV